MDDIKLTDNCVLPCSSLVELLRYRCSHTPNDTAFIFVSDNGESRRILTYLELDRLARCIAARLQPVCSPGDRALLLYPPGLDFIAAFFGCLYAGVAAVPAYPPRDNRNAERLRIVAEDVQTRLVLSIETQKNSIEQRLPAKGQTGTFEVVATDLLRGGESMWKEHYPEAGSLAFIQYTSGSSGNPKGVMVSHENILHNERVIQTAFGHTRESILVGWLPLFHDMGLIGNLLQPLYAGFPSILFSPTAFIQKPLMWLQLISQYRAITSGGPNFAYEHCINRITDEQKADLDLSCWENAFNGAEPIRAETLDRFSAAFASSGFRKEAFYPCYGMAETTLYITGGQRLTLPKTARLSVDGIKGATGDIPCVLEKVSCGFSRLDQKVLIVDPQTLEPYPDGHVGEIWTSGPSVTQGYWNCPEETEKIFKAYLADNGEGPFLRTGDLGFINEGELYVTGRCKDLIIIRGRNHYPQDIEQTVEQSHPALNPGGSAAFSVEVGGEERLVVLQEVKRSALRSLNTGEVCACVRRAVLQQHELGVYAVVLLKTSSIPKTSSGKIQRHQCRMKYLSGELEMVGTWCLDDEPKVSSNGVRPHAAVDRKTIENWLVANIARKTNVDSAQINLREPLAFYGLDSLAVVSLSGELEEWLGRKFSPTLVYDNPTVESLARYLAGEAEPVAYAGPVVDASSEKCADEPIAVIGMGCRFPGAPNPEAFWQLLAGGVNAVTSVPSSRWDSTRYPAATGHGGFLDAIDLFDPLFFGIAPREAECMDPQQRLLMEVTWEALESAFLPPGRLAGTRTGVFIGISSHDYSDQQQGALALYAATGNAQSIAANRISYALDLHGPSWSVDTACSSSLVAVHQACQSLRHGESDAAIAGGVNVLLSPDISNIFSQAGMLAEDGRCKTFDASADGYVRGEGCGVVILKRLSDARADGNPILALIRGSAVNQDGRSNGLTAPNGHSQQAVIRAALNNSGISPEHVGYVEAHGTGTPLGDPIEYNSLAEVFSSRSPSSSPCLIGSVKTNIGHLEAAAGIAGLIKSVLMLGHAQIPPHLHFQERNPHLITDLPPLVVPRQLEDWTECEHPRIAGISSFGMGGTNAHVVVQEAPPLATEEEEDSAVSAHALVLSARDESALTELAKRYDHLLHQHEASLPEICIRAATGREHFEHRLAVTGKTATHLRQGIASFLTSSDDVRFARGRAPGRPPKLVFLFPGQGPQYVQMGRMLYEREPLFRETMDRCARIADPLLRKPLLDVLYPGFDEVTEIDETTWTQPALFALGYSLAELWRSWGVVPDAVLGHSLGEYVAACVAGVFSLEDGMRLVTERGRLMQSIPAEGAMISVQAEERVLAEKIRPWSNYLSIAAVNGPKDCVLSGLRATLMSLAAQLAEEGYLTKELQVSQGFHSPLMDAVLGEFGKLADKVTYSAPRIPVVSNLTGTISDEVASSAYWVRHLRETVRFYEGIVELDRLGFNMFLEIGPKPLMLALAAPCLPAASVLLPSLQKRVQDQERMLRTLAELYARGVQVDWLAVHRERVARPCPALPAYPFQRKRYWRAERQEKPEPLIAFGEEWGALHPLLGRRLYSPLKVREVIFEAHFGKALPSFLGDYKLNGTKLFPAAGFVEMILAAARSYFGIERLQLENVTFISPLIFPCARERIVHTIIVPEEGNKATAQIYSFNKDDKAQEPDWILHASGTICPFGAEQDFEDDTHASDGVVVESFYQRCRSQGLEYGELFQGIREVRRSGEFARGDLVLNDLLGEEANAYLVHPALLDSALQVVGAILPEELEPGAWAPAAMGRLSFYRIPGNKAVSRAHLRPNLNVKGDTLTFDIIMKEDGGGCILRLEGFSLRRIPAGKKSYFSTLAMPEAKGENVERLSLAQSVSGKTGAELSDYLLSFFRQSLAGILCLEPDELPPDRPLNTLGLDSLMVFELTQKVHIETGLKLSLVEIMEGMTLQGLAVAVQSHLENSFVPIVSRADLAVEEAKPAYSSEQCADRADPAEMLANFHNLTDDEVRGLLSRMLEDDLPEDSSIGGI